MGLFGVLIGIIIIGVVVWAATTYIPMADPWKKLVYIVAIVVTLLWLARVFGLWQYDIPIAKP